MHDALTLARALYRALEAGEHGPALRALFHDDAYTLEHPNAIKPRGARVDLAGMTQASESGASLLRSQRFEIHSAVQVADTAIVRLTWHAVIDRAAGVSAPAKP